MGAAALLCAWLLMAGATAHETAAIASRSASDRKYMQHPPIAPDVVTLSLDGNGVKNAPADALPVLCEATQFVAARAAAMPVACNLPSRPMRYQFDKR